MRCDAVQADWWKAEMQQWRTISGERDWKHRHRHHHHYISFLHIIISHHGTSYFISVRGDSTSSSHPQNCHFGKFFKLPVLLHDGESTFWTQRQTFPPKSIDADYPRVNWDQLLCMAGCWWSSESSLHCADHWPSMEMMMIWKWRYYLKGRWSKTMM